MTKEELKKSATQLLWTLGLIEVAGWSLIVLPVLKVVDGPVAIVVMALGIVIVVACLFGAIWTAVQLARIQGGK